MAPRSPEAAGATQVERLSRLSGEAPVCGGIAQQQTRAVARVGGDLRPAPGAVAEAGLAKGPHACLKQPGGSARLRGILDLAEKCCLCTKSQKYMMLDYVRSGRFAEEYYRDMWSRRLQDHSMEAAALLRDLLAKPVAQQEGPAASIEMPASMREGQAAPPASAQPSPAKRARIEAPSKHEAAAAGAPQLEPARPAHIEVQCRGQAAAPGVKHPALQPEPARPAHVEVQCRGQAVAPVVARLAPRPEPARPAQAEVQCRTQAAAPGVAQPRPTEPARGEVPHQGPAAASPAAPQLGSFKPAHPEVPCRGRAAVVDTPRPRLVEPSQVEAPCQGRAAAADAPRPGPAEPTHAEARCQRRGAAAAPPQARLAKVARVEVGRAAAVAACLRSPGQRRQVEVHARSGAAEPRPAFAEPVKVEEAHVDEWLNAPCELLRRATRAFEREADEPEAPAGSSDEGELAELADPDAASLPQPFLIPRALHGRLRPYQRAGVAWMAGLSHGAQGGILADEMGLGKTVQTCAFLNGIRRTGARHALVLVPVTLLEQWASEAWEWCANWPVYVYHGSAAQRARALQNVMRPAGGILLTSYSVLSRGGDDGHLLQVSLADPGAWRTAKQRSADGRRGADGRRADGKHGALRGRREPWRPLGRVPQPAQRASSDGAEQKPWDVVICDEAHAMRNISTLVGKRLRRVRAKCRILLTGTPVQNALQDLWALMDFAQPGLLGNHETFVKHFSDPIDRGSVRGASPFAVGLKRHLCEQLWRLLQPHLLRRTKSSVGLVRGPAGTPTPDAGAAAAEGGAEEAEPPLPSKDETVVWLLPTEEQKAAYLKVLETSDVIRQANSKAKAGFEVFRAIALLKRLCNHPVLGLPLSLPGAWQYLLAEASSSRPGQGRGAVGAGCPPGPSGGGEPQADDGEEEGAGAGQAVEGMLRALPLDVEALLSQSSKLRCLAAMLPALISRGHRVLVFSQGVKMMDLVELCILRRQGIEFLRIDGQTDVQSRAERVRMFQEERDKYHCMLLTTGVGGYGLNLTGADRVVLLDPAWNPATDLQAVDRAFRIGQQREVRVYRLVMSGLIEDKMFRLQVFKLGLTKTALEAKQHQRYFTTSEIRGLFQWTDPACGETRKLLVDGYSKEEDEQVLARARADGSDEGWFAAGPAIGLSNFSLLYSAAVRDEDEVDVASRTKVAELTEKLDVADKKVQDASESRKGVEDKLKAAQMAMEDAAQQLSSVAGAKSEAAELLKQKQAGLAEAKRLEAAAEKQSKKALRVQAMARVRTLNAERCQLEADQAKALAVRGVEDAGKAALEAKEAMAKAFATAEGVLSRVGEDGKAKGGGRVDAAAAKVKAVLKAFAQARKAVDAALAAQEAVECAEEAVIKANGTIQEAEPAGPAPKKSEAVARSSEKDHAKAARAQEKVRERGQGARDGATRAAEALAEAGGELADAFQGSRDRASTAGQVKSAQSEARAAFRQAGAAWHALRASQEAWAKAATSRSRATQRASAAAAAHAAACSRLAAAGREAAAADAEVLKRRRERSSLERLAAEAGAARATAAAQEAGQKRKRSECKAVVGAAKAALKPAKAAQKQAAVLRANLMKEDGKVEPDVVVTTASEAISAVRALREEQYDANQVEEAQAKKKQRCWPTAHQS